MILFNLGFIIRSFTRFDFIVIDFVCFPINKAFIQDFYENMIIEKHLE